MNLIILFALVTGLCFLIYFLTVQSYDTEGFAVVGCMFGMILSVFIIAIPISRMSAFGKIEQFKSVRETVDTARANTEISEIELAALQQEIVEANTWLKESKYYAKNSWVGVYTPKEVLALEPIK